MRFSSYYSAILLLSLGACCALKPTVQQPLQAYFSPMLPFDTLQLAITSGETDSIVAGSVISNRLFYSTIPPKLLDVVFELVDSSDTQIIGRQYFPLADGILAYWVEIRWFWYRFHGILLYDTAKSAFTDYEALAAWYGGDGSQVLMESWILDVDGDGKKDIVQCESLHSIIMGGEEPIDSTEEIGTLKLWKQGHFIAMPVDDTTRSMGCFRVGTGGANTPK